MSSDLGPATYFHIIEYSKHTLSIIKLLTSSLPGNGICYMNCDMTEKLLKVMLSPNHNLLIHSQQ